MGRINAFRGLLGISFGLFLIYLTPKIDAQDNTTLCVPQCDKHAVCVSPNICVCSKGYNMDAKGHCKIVCPTKCGEHEVCVEPGICACATGYVKDNNSICMPKCEPRCGLHSYCASFNHCKCHKGYNPNDIKSLSCSLPMQWWVNLLIGLMAVLIVCSVGGIIFYFVSRSRNVNYYPNSNFTDTTRIVENN